MAPHLEDLSNEIIENIVKLLVFSDICSLRGSSRAMKAKTTQYHFKSYFRSKRVEIKDSALEAFVARTQPGEIGCLVQHLVLVGVVNNTKWIEYILKEGKEKRNGEKKAKAQQDLDILEQRQAEYEELHKAGQDVGLLTKAFSNIVANGKTGKLLSLSLEVVVYREDAMKKLSPLAGGSWRYIWKSATDTFHLALRSLAASTLPIERLNIFNNRQLQRCSLPSNELGNIDATILKGLAVSLAHLKSMSVSFSDRIIFYSTKDEARSEDPAERRDWGATGDERSFEDIRAEMEDEANFTGLGKLLRLSTQLEDLELHQYLLETGHRERLREKLLQRTAEMDRPPKLKRLELRGLFVKGQDLLALIQRLGVRSLFLNSVSMTSGSFRPLFDYCTSDAAGMTELRFNELFEDGLRVYFDVPGPCVIPALRGHPGGSDLIARAGAEVKRQIDYNSSEGALQGSPASMDYMRKRSREFGPPLRGAT